MSTEEILSKSVLIHGPEILNKCLADPLDVKSYLERIYQERLDYPIPRDKIDPTNWYIPDEYKILDIEEFLVDQCPKKNYERLITELKLYRKHEMIPILRAMKYIVDILRKNNIVWGVGRGSSVASYVLYLIGVHKIDSVKYDLPIEEFFKGE
jgi:DNA polymerase III alpha subunit